MDARVDSDYDMVYEPDENATKKLLSDAQRFVDRAVTYLAAAGFKV